MAVRNTVYTVTDASGKALCHAPASSKSDLNSTRKRAAREAFEAMCREAGMVTDNGWWTCAVTGTKGRRNSTERQTWASEAVIDMGHVIPDADGGAFCPCNFGPQVRADNLACEADNNAHLIPATFVATDPRVHWRAVWERTAKPSRIAKAV